MDTNRYEQYDEVTLLRLQREKRKMKKQREIMIAKRIIRYLTYLFIASLVGIIIYIIQLEKQFDFKGKVEDSCQDLDTLRKINDQIYPLIDELTYKKFFRIFRVNLQNDCPFWVGNYICTNRKCAVCECNQTDIPQNWLAPLSAPVEQPEVDYAFWGSERDNKVSNWVWHVEDTNNDNGAYVDLKINPEGYTGYQGQHIWEAIYNENCFKGSEWDTLCKEERALNKMISGLHTSISTQLSEYYVDIERNRTYPSYPLYFQKVGTHQDRIKNLFFLYSVMLRALNIAQPVVTGFDINSQNFQDDMDSKNLIQKVYNLTLSQCSHPFDEKSFFKEIKMETKRQYQHYIHNISMIMDCVECEKCKVYGKMQTYGLGTALKVMFNGDPDNFNDTIKRNELIAFINTFAKISSSVYAVSQMYERRYKSLVNLGCVILFGGGIILLFLLCVVKIYEEQDKKINKMFGNVPREEKAQQVNKPKKE